MLRGLRDSLRDRVWVRLRKIFGDMIGGRLEQRLRDWLKNLTHKKEERKNSSIKWGSLQFAVEPSRPQEAYMGSSPVLDELSPG